MLSEVQVALTAIDDAVHALQQQKVAVQEKLKAHQAAWLTINCAHRQAQCSKVFELEALCDKMKALEQPTLPEPMDTEILAETSVSSLQALVASLQAQLRALADPATELTNASTEALEASVNAANAEAFANPPSAMDESEVAARLQRAEELAAATSKGGKGKGKSDEQHY